MSNRKHGDAVRGTPNHQLYEIWQGMKARCYKHSHVGYKYYGGRGLTVCDDWQSYTTFRDWALTAGWQPGLGLTLDRIDNNIGYCPENCRLVTMEEQAHNRSNNITYTMNGETLCLAEWAKKLGFAYTTLYSRIKDDGMSFEEAVNTPVKGK